MAFQTKDYRDEAKSTGIELQEVGQGNGEMTPPHIVRDSEEEKRSEHEDYAHMARLGKRQQFDVRASVEHIRKISNDG